MGFCFDNCHRQIDELSKPYSRFTAPYEASRRLGRASANRICFFENPF